MTYRNPYDRNYNPHGTYYVARLITQIDSDPKLCKERNNTEVVDMSALPRFDDGASGFFKIPITMHHSRYKVKFSHK